MDSLLHTPEGVRDIYNEECSKKNALSAKLDRILKLYGYKDIQTPTFEFFDIFNRERGSVPSTQYVQVHRQRRFYTGSETGYHTVYCESCGQVF